MAKMQITIHEDGDFDIDLQEGFTGQSCVEKANIIALSLGNGISSEEKKKDEYYQMEPEEDIKVLLSK